MLAISFMTVAESFEGALRAGWSESRIERLKAVLRSYLAGACVIGSMLALGTDPL